MVIQDTRIIGPSLLKQIELSLEGCGQVSEALLLKQVGWEKKNARRSLVIPGGQQWRSREPDARCLEISGEWVNELEHERAGGSRETSEKSEKGAGGEQKEGD